MLTSSGVDKQTRQAIKHILKNVNTITCRQAAKEAFKNF